MEFSFFYVCHLRLKFHAPYSSRSWDYGHRTKNLPRAVYGNRTCDVAVAECSCMTSWKSVSCF
jgi:hypothetical protein